MTSFPLRDDWLIRCSQVRSRLDDANNLRRDVDPNPVGGTHMASTQQDIHIHQHSHPSLPLQCESLSLLIPQVATSEIPLTFGNDIYRAIDSFGAVTGLEQPVCSLKTHLMGSHRCSRPT
jgi:hypothetical protein